MISLCAAYSNALDGIQAGNRCLVINNTCGTNGNNGDGAGIHVTSLDTRVESNNCTGADRGIDVDFGGNFIVRNTCSGNTTNWDIAAGNVCFVIIATTSPAFTGLSGGVSPGTTDPNANFTY